MIRFLLNNSFSQLQSIAGFWIDGTDEVERDEMRLRRNRVAVDLGSGCGLTAMALLCAGYDVVATDKGCLLPLLSDNLTRFEVAKRSHSSTSIAEFGTLTGVLEMDWTSLQSQTRKQSQGSCSDSSEDGLEGGQKGSASDIADRLLSLCHGKNPDLVVCSDCLYSSASVEPLLDVLEMVMIIICSRSFFR